MSTAVWTAKKVAVKLSLLFSAYFHLSLVFLVFLGLCSLLFFSSSFSHSSLLSPLLTTHYNTYSHSHTLAHTYTIMSLGCFLIAQEPFTTAHIQFHDGVFDQGSRMFTSILQSWKNVCSDSANVKVCVYMYMYMYVHVAGM